MTSNWTLPCYLVTLSTTVTLGCSDNASKNTAPVGCPSEMTAVQTECLGECPTGWNRNKAGQCSPPCPEGFNSGNEDCTPPCPPGTIAVDNGCEPEGIQDVPGACTSEKWNDEGLEGGETIYFVDATAKSGGDGSNMAPFVSFQEALEAIDPNEATKTNIVLAAGDYNFVSPLFIPPLTTLRILGKCADETQLRLSEDESLSVYASDDLALDLRRITLASIVVSGAKNVHISECRFDVSNLDQQAISWIGSGAIDEALNVERSAFQIEYSEAIYVNDVEAISLKGNRYDIGSGSGSGSVDKSAILVTSFQSFKMEDSLFEGSGYTGITLGTSEKTEEVVLSKNRFFGMWTANPIFVSGESSSTTRVRISETTVENRCPSQNSISLVQIPTAELSGLRISDQSERSISASNVSALSVSRSKLTGNSTTAARLNYVETADFTGNYFSGATEAAVETNFSGLLSMSSNTLTGNRHGIVADGGRLFAQFNAIGANTGSGIKTIGLAELDVADNVLGSNASTGIDLSLFEGTTDSVFSISNNTVMESVGLGISVRSGGDGLVDISKNKITGMFPGRLVNAGIAEEIGDGIGLVTGTDKVPTRARVNGNSILNNIRLGVLVHGEGTEADVNSNQFGEGNGYGNILNEDELLKAAPNLLYQSDALITGADQSLAQAVSGVAAFTDLTADAPSAEE